MYDLLIIPAYIGVIVIIWAIVICYRFVRAGEVINFDSNKDFMRSLRKVIKHHSKEVKYSTLGE